MFQFSQQINPIFPSNDGRDCTKDAKDGYSRAIRNGYSKDFRHDRANHKHDKIEVHQKNAGFGQGNEMTVLFRHTKRRLLSLLLSCDVN